MLSDRPIVHYKAPQSKTPLLDLVLTSNLQNGAVSHFYFFKRLWMADRGEPMVNVKFHAKLFKLQVIEISSIIGNDGIWQSEPTYDGFLEKILDLLLGDLCQQLNFNLLSKVVNCNDPKLSLPDCL